MVHYFCWNKDFLFCQASVGKSDFFLLGSQDPLPVRNTKTQYSYSYYLNIKLRIYTSLKLAGVPTNKTIIKKKKKKKKERKFPQG